MQKPQAGYGLVVGTVWGHKLTTWNQSVIWAKTGRRAHDPARNARTRSRDVLFGICRYSKPPLRPFLPRDALVSHKKRHRPMNSPIKHPHHGPVLPGAATAPRSKAQLTPAWPSFTFFLPPLPFLRKFSVSWKSRAACLILYFALVAEGRIYRCLAPSVRPWPRPDLPLQYVNSCPADKAGRYE